MDIHADDIEVIYKKHICKYCKNKHCKMELLTIIEDGCTTTKCLDYDLDKELFQEESRKKQLEREFDRIQTQMRYKRKGYS